MPEKEPCIFTIQQPLVSDYKGIESLPWISGGTFDPLALTEEKAMQRDSEAQAADRSRFRTWAEVRNALRNQNL